MPPPTPPPPHSPPSTVSLGVKVTAHGDLTDPIFSEDGQGAIKQKFATAAGVEAETVGIVVQGGSVFVTLTIPFVTEGDCLAVRDLVFPKLQTPAKAAQTLGIPVTVVTEPKCTVASPSQPPSQPPPSPPPPPPPSSPPSAVTLGTTVTTADDVSDFTAVRRAEVTKKYADAAVVGVQTVTLVVKAGSAALLEFTNGFDTMGECIIVRQKVFLKLQTAALATSVLGVPVTVDPVFDCTVASPSQPPSPPPPSPSPPSPSPPPPPPPRPRSSPTLSQ